MSEKVRFALVGCGAISAKHIVSLSRIAQAELVAVCDKNATAAERVGQANGVPFYTDYMKMAEREQPDVFSILTPSGTHAPILLDLVESGHHFVIEKPLALRIADADDMIEACDRHGVKLFVVQQNRFNKPIRMLKHAITQGRFGKIVLGTVRLRWRREQAYYSQKAWRGTWQHDGGVLTNQASHHIDMLCWLLGDVESVMSMTTTRLLDIETEDTGVALLRFCDGALGVIEATVATRPIDLEGSISVLGEKGTVVVGGFFMNELKTWEFSEKFEEDARAFEEWGRNPDLNAWNHTEYLRDVIECLQSGKRSLVDGIEGRRSLELITAIYEAAETQRQVPLRFRPRHCRLGMGPATDGEHRSHSS